MGKRNASLAHPQFRGDFGQATHTVPRNCPVTSCEALAELSLVSGRGFCPSFVRERGTKTSKREQLGRVTFLDFTDGYGWLCTACRPNFGFEPEGLEFKSLRARHFP